MKCVHCDSEQVIRQGRDKNGFQCWRCKDCSRIFKDKEDKVALRRAVKVRASGILGDVEWVYQNMLLTGEELRRAKSMAPNGALTILDAVNNDAMFKRTFLNTMVPKLFLNEKKLDEEAGQKRETKILTDVIDKMIDRANRDADELVRASSQESVGQPALPQVVGASSGERQDSARAALVDV